MAVALGVGRWELGVGSWAWHETTEAGPGFSPSPPVLVPAVSREPGDSGQSPSPAPALLYAQPLVVPQFAHL